MRRFIRGRAGDGQKAAATDDTRSDDNGEPHPEPSVPNDDDDDEHDEESTPLTASVHSSYAGGEESTDDDDDEDLAALKPTDRREAKRAERLSMRLLAVADHDSDEEDRIVRRSLRLLAAQNAVIKHEDLDEQYESFPSPSGKGKSFISFHFWLLVIVGAIALGLCLLAVYVGVQLAGPPKQPVGPYQLIERQEGWDLLDFYDFYVGKDSVGSNGYNMYVSKLQAEAQSMLNVTYEIDEAYQTNVANISDTNASSAVPFLYVGTASTPKGPRDSIRLEGIRRFNRGLFIIDLRHMPVGCGVWPAFWLTDEANWPVNGEIDIVEGVNYQRVAKTALHATQTCDMSDIPLGVMTGGWDTAQGIPDADTGIADMTLRYAKNCYVYDPHQWLNQGCVAVDEAHESTGSLGRPLNALGGGVFALEWDPINRHIRTWAFTPHSTVPENLRQAMETAHLEDVASEYVVAPDPQSWPLPYGYFAIGEGTNCDAYHFRHMRLVINTAFCGSVAGNRYHKDCPVAQRQNYSTCNEYVASQPAEMKEAYWKIRGVYVYERAWESTWLT